MPEELNLVRDLAVILVSAGLFTIISKALKQPLILGYIAAGLLVGPYVDFFPGISSHEAVQEWSEIGVIFLMFALGLEFSFKKLLKVGSPAMMIAGVKFLGVFAVGFLVGKAVGWTSMESIFLGGLLSMSSTAVVIKSYEDMGLKGRPYASLVFGTLVIEDLIAILLMVLLSTLAVSQQFSGLEMVGALAKLAFFIVLWFLGGIYLIPTLLAKARKHMSDEILLIVSIGLCFGMVTLATSAGFSSALGAFVMGSILAETIESERITKLVGGIKNLFSAVFFVSVGMMLNPSVILQNWAIILLLVIVVIATHILFCTIGGIVSGKSFSDSLHTGFSLAQLGEFGFIIAGVGTSLSVMRDSIYPIIVAVSVITTFTTPYFIRMADKAALMLESRIPLKWRALIERNNQSIETKSGTEKSAWIAFLKSWILRVGLYGVILLAILIGSKSYFEPFVGKVLESWNPIWLKLLCTGGTLLAMAPFLYGISVIRVNNEKARELIETKSNNRIPLLGLILVQIFIAISFVLFLLASYFHLSWWTLLAVALALMVFIIAGRRSVVRFNKIENQFLQNLNAKEELEKKVAPVATTFRSEFSDYDVHVASVRLPSESDFAGKALKDIPFRSNSGVNVVKIQRGNRSIQIPSGDEIIYPGDFILAAGTSSQNEAFKKLIEGSVRTNQGEESHDFCILPIKLSNHSSLTGKTLSGMRLRDYGVMVICVMHDGDLTTNPASDFRFSEGDMVWLAGDKKSCEWFKG